MICDIESSGRPDQKDIRVLLLSQRGILRDNAILSLLGDKHRVTAPSAMVKPLKLKLFDYAGDTSSA